MGRQSLNRTATIRLSLTPETRARLSEYSLERQLSVSQLVSDWIWSIPLKSDGKATGMGEEPGQAGQPPQAR